jgi:hypothetical protein
LELTLAHLRRARSLAAGKTQEAVQVSDLVRHARTVQGFGSFCEVFNKPPAAHHLVWHKEIITGVNTDALIGIGGQNLNILAPRGSAKSTCLSLLVAWLIGLHTEMGRMLRTLYLGYSLDIARSRSHTIKALIQTAKYRSIFPMVRLSKLRQSDELWSIDYEYGKVELDGDDPYSLVAQGLGGSITSRRSQLIVIDDPVKSSESIQNPEVRRKLVTNWTEVVQPTLVPGGRAVSLGTRFLVSDISGTTFNEKNKWKVITQRAIQLDENGLEVSYWPERFKLAALQELRRQDPISFSFQFQNSPVSRSEMDFPGDWLVSGPICENYDAIAVGMDLSSGLKERNDWTVMLLGGLIGDRVEFVDYIRMRSMGNIEKLDDLCSLLADWGLLEDDESEEDPSKRYTATDLPVTVKLEGISYQASLKGDAVKVLHQQRHLDNIQLSSVTKWHGDKMRRLRGTFGLFQQKKVIWNEYINWEPVWSELLNFGMADHDDCVDAMVLCLRALLGPGAAETAFGEWEDGSEN